MKLSWVDTEHSQDAGPVLVTGFTEKIAILTRVAPATPPGSEASDLERNRENNVGKSSPGVISQFQRTNATSHPFHSTLQCARGQSFYEEQLIWFSLYISFPGRAHLLSGDRKHMTSLDGLREERRFLTSQLWRNPLSAA